MWPFLNSPQSPCYSGQKKAAGRSEHRRISGSRHPGVSSSSSSSSSSAPAGEAGQSLGGVINSPLHENMAHRPPFRQLTISVSPSLLSDALSIVQSELVGCPDPQVIPATAITTEGWGVVTRSGTRRMQM